jgi:hypothetical protein
MKLNKIEEVEVFMALVDSCEGEVYLTSQYGDRYNLKSKLTQYLAVAQLLNKENDLELWCDKKKDENKFLQFFKDYPETL